MIEFKQEIAGWFKLEKLKVDENGVPIESTRCIVADWFPNLITNQGLNRMGANADYTNACQVGSGTNAPSVTDTGLQTFVAGTSTIQSTSDVAQGSAPYYGSRTRVYRFSAGAAAGNLSEVGIGWATTGGTLFSRARILDGIGDPTTITVLSDEMLDVTYQLRSYPPLSDVTGTVSISSVNYDVIIRAAGVTTPLGWAPGGTAGSGGGVAYNGVIGAITGFPSGSADPGVPMSFSAYSENSLERVGSCTWGLNQGNLSGGIRSVNFRFGFSNMQCQFDPALPKDSTKTLTLSFKTSWARKTL